MVVCPDCKDYRTKEVLSGYSESGESIKDILGFDSSYATIALDLDNVVSKSQLPLLDHASVSALKTGLEEIYSGIVLGKGPNESYCIGLDRTCNVDAVAVPLLINAYRNGLTVARLTSTPYYRSSVVGYEDRERQLMTSDIAAVMIPSGVEEAEVLTAKGIMQARATSGKPTILVTSRPQEYLSEILSVEGERSRYMATPLFVHYTKSKSTEENILSKQSRFKDSPFGRASQGGYGPVTSLEELNTL